MDSLSDLFCYNNREDLKVVLENKFLRLMFTDVNLTEVGVRYKIIDKGVTRK